MVKLKNIKIKDTVVSITEFNKEDYICLTDMATAKYQQEVLNNQSAIKALKRLSDDTYLNK